MRPTPPTNIASSSSFGNPSHLSACAAGSTQVYHDCEIEFDQIPNHVFSINPEKLGLVVNMPTNQGGAPYHPVKFRSSGQFPFPQSLIIAYRVEGDSFALSNEEGLIRLIERGFSTLIEGIDASTDLKYVLAAMAVQECLRLTTQNGIEAAIRAKEIAKERLEDLLLIRDTFRELGITTSNGSDIAAASSSYVRMASPSYSQHASVSLSTNPDTPTPNPVPQVPFPPARSTPLTSLNAETKVDQGNTEAANKKCVSTSHAQEAIASNVDVEKHLKLALRNIERLERENSNLRNALSEAYYGGETFNSVPPKSEQTANNKTSKSAARPDGRA
jgi:hypothetical protein